MSLLSLATCHTVARYHQVGEFWCPQTGKFQVSRTALSRDEHFNDVAISIHGHHMQAYEFCADVRTVDCRDHAWRTEIGIIHIPPSCAIGACGDRGHAIHSVLVIILLGDEDTGDLEITGPTVGPC